jgi:RNA polymerase sigma-70 factor (ECF subfamily)
MLNEQEIIQMLQKADTREKAFEQVVREYQEPIYWQIRRLVLNHEDADDVVQNVFLKAWSHLDHFHHESKLSTWLYRIAVNESIDFLRKKKNFSVVSTDHEEGSVVSMLMADEYFDGDATQAQLQEAIARLPEVQRTVFNLRYFEDMKYSDMSELLHTTEGSLKASYHIAVKKISEFFRQRD